MTASSRLLLLIAPWVIAAGCARHFDGDHESRDGVRGEREGRRGHGKGECADDAGPHADAEWMPDAGTTGQVDAGTPASDAGAALDAAALDVGRTIACAADGNCPMGLRCEQELCVPCPASGCGCLGDDDCASGERCNRGTFECEPERTCADETTEAACLARAGCRPVYGGFDCVDADGLECTSGDRNCTCAEFRFAVCMPIP